MRSSSPRMASASPSGAKLAATLEAIPRNAPISTDRRAHIAAASVYNIWGVWPWALVDAKRLPRGSLSTSWLEAVRALARTGRSLKEAQRLLAAGGSTILERAEIQRAIDLAKAGRDRLTPEAEVARTPPRTTRKRAASPSARASQTPKKARREVSYPVRTHEDDGPILGEIIARPHPDSDYSSREATISADEATAQSVDDALSDPQQDEDQAAGSSTTNPAYRLKDFDPSFTTDEEGTPTPQGRANGVQTRQSTISAASSRPAKRVQSTDKPMSSAQASAEGTVTAPLLGLASPKVVSTPNQKTPNLHHGGGASVLVSTEANGNGPATRITQGEKAVPRTANPRPRATDGSRAISPRGLGAAQTLRSPRQALASGKAVGYEQTAPPQSAGGPPATGHTYKDLPKANDLLSPHASQGTPRRDTADGAQLAISPRSAGLAELASVAGARFRANADWATSKQQAQAAGPPRRPASTPASTSCASNSGDAPLSLTTAEAVLRTAGEAVSNSQAALSELSRKRTDAEAALEVASRLLKEKEASVDALQAFVSQADSILGDFPQLRASRDGFAAQLAVVQGELEGADKAIQRARAEYDAAVEEAQAAQAALLTWTQSRDQARAQVDEARRALAASQQRAFDKVTGVGPAGFSTILARLLGLDDESQVETVMGFLVEEYLQRNPAPASGAAP